MTRPRKFRPGPVITDPTMAVDYALKGRWLMLRGVPKHPSVMISMQVRTLAGFARYGLIRMALRGEGAS